MKICRIYIKGYQQFKDTLIDFTNPETDEPADKICFIGRNGTGKSTILSILRWITNASFGMPNAAPWIIEVQLKNIRGYQICVPGLTNFFVKKEIDKNDKIWIKEFLDWAIFNRHDIQKEVAPYIIFDPNITMEFMFAIGGPNIIIFSPPESVTNTYLGINNVPNATVNSALGIFNNFPFYHEVSNHAVDQFWTMLIFLMKKREDERNVFENLPSNLNKTKSQLIDEFNKVNPKILDKIAILWNKILEGANLEFDVEHANNPVQLNDNLLAYIIHKKTRQKIEYNQLSTGIRNFIFRLGHIYSLYFNREIKKGFVFIDEPENSLFPDFLYDLIDVYQGVMKDKDGENNTQLFVSTHSPIIAAQFEPYERVILEWDEEGYIKAFKGNAPIGDDPNDLLEKDFGINNVMGKEGQKMWDEYLKLRRELRESKDKNGNDELIHRINKIGTDYNFGK